MFCCFGSREKSSKGYMSVNKQVRYKSERRIKHQARDLKREEKEC